MKCAIPWLHLPSALGDLGPLGLIDGLGWPELLASSCPTILLTMHNPKLMRTSTTKTSADYIVIEGFEAPL